MLRLVAPIRELGWGRGGGAFLSGSNRTVKVNAIPGSRRFFFGGGGEAGALLSEFYGAHKLVTEMEVLLHAI